jgi:hypothetical protein
MAYDYKNKHEEPEPTTWATGGANDLRSLIEYKRAHRDSMAGGALSGKQFNNRYDYCSKENRIVDGNKVTLMLKRKDDSKNNALTGPVRAEHTEIKRGAENRAEDNSPVKKTSIYYFLKKKLRVSESLPQNFACKNTESKDNFRRAINENKFRVPASNPDEKYRLQKTEEMTPECKFAPRKRLLKRKSTDPPGGPAPRIRRGRALTFNSEDSEVIVPGSFTNNVNNNEDNDVLLGTEDKFAPRKRLLRRNTTDPPGRPAPERRRAMQLTFTSLEDSEVIVPESSTNNVNNDHDNDVLVCTVDDILREIDDMLMDRTVTAS